MDTKWENHLICPNCGMVQDMIPTPDQIGYGSHDMVCKNCKKKFQYYIKLVPVFNAFKRLDVDYNNND
jgi:transcription elongation factor Elf1